MADDLGDIWNSGTKMIGRAIGRIVSIETGSHVGFLYQWNTGETEEAWFEEPEERYSYEMFGVNTGERAEAA
ncbi:hypothetical protein DYI37_18930 [Fulvimarina endophytica]|uniref:Uncharacterized protein n=1 Tax=Fulvimarina endophytica TaxID=2293836 RepID=A0A371WY22_9HYPH|nr:hypothetical protein [Fulvimarina endophytica]RFC61900.1 hypothetical protein DYI37_18930 [Fulvimarina endophytica]